MSRYFKAALLENRQVAADHWRLAFAPPAGSSIPQAGQFFMIGVPDRGDPLLKRPFSLHKITESGHVEVLYRVRGKGTRMLTHLKAGDPVEILGPLGNSFPLEETGTPVLVAGGLGVVPLVELARVLSARSPMIFLGARTESELLCEADLRGISPHLTLVTEDGTAGTKGLVTEALSVFLASGRDCTVYACGPAAMLRAVSDICLGGGVRGYVSLEEHMACGVGACMGCVTDTVEGYRRVCREGPVFPMGKVRFFPLETAASKQSQTRPL